VESVIEAHYAAQIAEIEASEPELAAELAQFREEELGHQKEAVEAGAREAPGAGLIAAVIRAGCRAAIGISERI
jgi:ubiquinone biosynthesis monooxygenase Coq7